MIHPLISFLKNPKSLKHKGRTPYINAVIEFIRVDAFLIFSYSLLNAFLFFIFDDYKTILNSRNVASNSIDRWLIVIIIAPLLEEIAFRLGLKINRKNISISLGIQFVFLLKIFNLVDCTFCLRLLLITIFSAVFYFFFSKKCLPFFSKYKNIFIYYNILTFGLIHSFNYNFFENYQFLFIPFLISIQLGLGIYLSFSRLKYGFITALSFHVLHNAFFFTLDLLIK